jgi:nitric oxide synthase-interacting protein
MHTCFNVILKCCIICYRSDGYLFDKEAILEYIITKKTEYYRKLKEYEKQKRKGEV